jgi:hypothetical protein
VPGERRPLAPEGLAAELSAEHGFLNDHKGAGDRNPLVFAMMAQFTGGADYHVPSARDEPRRIIALFHDTLKSRG